MKNLNKLMGVLLFGGCIGSVSAADIDSKEVATVPIADEVQATKPITLRTVNGLREDPDVTVLFALPPLPKEARPHVAFSKNSIGLKKSDVQINGRIYDLWTNDSSWDLEREGGSAGYTLDKGVFPGDSSKETWYTNYYLVNQGTQPGESENALDMTGQIPGLSGTVYVFLGEIFLNQRDAKVDDNDGERANLATYRAERQRVLAARKSSSN